MEIRQQAVRSVVRLWNELDEFPASQPDDALRHCLTTLGRLIGARNCGWIGAIRADAEGPAKRLRGWQARVVRPLHRDDAYDKLVAQILDYFRQDVADPRAMAMVARAGTTRACLREDLVSDAAWKTSWWNHEVLRPAGIHHELLGSHALDNSNEAYLYVSRGRRERPFGPRERDLLLLFLTGCRMFQREMMRSYGLVDATAPLSPRERDVLQLLLTDLTEKEIAARLGLTWRTTHQYVVAVLRKFGVSGRTGLMARWLRHQGERARPARGADGRARALADD